MSPLHVLLMACMAMARHLILLCLLVVTLPLSPPADGAPAGGPDAAGASATSASAASAWRGFRMLDYTVASETAAPRACFRFSRPLARGATDFAKFVSVNNEDPSAVKVEGRRLCVEGLAHGRRYDIKIRAGLPSASDEHLARTLDVPVHMRDRAPLARFLNRNAVLPHGGPQSLPLATVNVSAIQAELYRIRDRRLVNELAKEQAGDQAPASKIAPLQEGEGEKLWAGALSIRSMLNEEAITALPIDELRPDLEPGLYVMIARPARTAAGGTTGATEASQWFIVSDLGLSAISGTDGVHVFVRSLASARALPGVDLRLIARNGETLAEATSGADGHVHFEGSLALGVGGFAPALVTARDAAGDDGFLDLTRSAFDLSDRKVDGRQSPGPLDAMLFADRGSYRPGEDVHLTALLRDAAGRAAPGVPLTLKIYRPDGVEQGRRLVGDAGEGGRTVGLSLDEATTPGTWRVSAHADPAGPPIGETTFVVARQAPRSLDLALAPEAPAVPPDRPVVVDVSARTLFGAPAAGLAIEGEVDVAPRASAFAGLEGYHFGLEQEDATSVRRPIEDAPKTDAEGRARLQAALPAAPVLTRPLVASVTARLVEPGGRRTERSVALPVTSEKPFIGVRPTFRDGHADSGQPASFDVIVVDAEGRPVARRGLRWSLSTLHTRFQWYFRDGRWSHEAITWADRAAGGALDVAADGPARLSVPVAEGRHRLDIVTPVSGEAAASLSFEAGWRAGDISGTPDGLDIALDKAAYRAGDQATVRILPRMAGEAVVAVVSDRLLAAQTVSVAEDGGAASFTVDGSWGPGAYVTVMLFRPMLNRSAAARTSAAPPGRMPGRAIGVKWLPLDASARTLQVDIAAPEKVRPNQKLDLVLRTSGPTGGEKAHVAVAAADAGALGLTDEEVPDPARRFFGQRRLGVEFRDLYGKLIDAAQGARGVVRVGGDRPPPRRDGREPDARTVSLSSGVFETDAEGRARISLDIPQFEGALRIMAVAWNGERAGHGVKDVAVHDPVAVMATPPAFLTLGDRAETPVALQNLEGPEGDYTVVALPEGGVTVKETARERKVWLKPGGRSDLVTPLKADRPGPAALRLAITGPNGLSLTRRYVFRIRPAGPPVARPDVVALAAGETRRVDGSRLIAGLIPETARVTLGAGGEADMAGLLSVLDRPLSRSAEAITSQALPLLYHERFADAAGLAGERGARERVARAIARLTQLQGAAGAFGLWAAGRQESRHDLWLTAYVADFLLRAREQGFATPPRTLDNALERLRRAVNTADAEFGKGGEDLAYALYVLARAGRAVMGELRYYADEKIAGFATPLAQAQIGAALAMLGDGERAGKAFLTALGRLGAGTPEADADRTRDFGSPLRDGAAVLTLIAESRVSPAAAAQAAEAVRRLRAARPALGAQESAWLLLAARPFAQDDRASRLEVDGAPVAAGTQRVIGGGQLGERPLELRNASDAPLSVSLVATGAAAAAEPAAASGLAIERVIYTPGGQAVAPDRIGWGAQIIIALKITGTEAGSGRLLVEDHLPAGFEIDSPALVSGSDWPAFSWLSASPAPAHVAFREDGVQAAFSLPGDGGRAAPGLMLAYVARAALPGEYAHAGARVEDGGRPERFARTAPGKVRIVRKEQNP